jgi:predicted DNA-binding protein
MARGRKPQRDAKRKLLVIRFQHEEYNAIEAYAKSQGKPISTFVREITLQHLESMNVPTSLAPDNPNQLKIDTD